MKAKKLQSKRLTASTANVKLEMRRPETWLAKAREWNIPIENFTVSNLLHIVQYKIHDAENNLTFEQYMQQRSSHEETNNKTVSAEAIYVPPTAEDTKKLLGQKLVGTAKTINYCAKCMRPVVSVTAQSRSADEGMDTTYNCVQCGRTSLYNKEGHDYDDDEPEELLLNF